MEIISIFFSRKSLLQNCSFSSLLLSSSFIRWKKERERMGMKEMADMPSLFESLAGAICQ